MQHMLQSEIWLPVVVHNNLDDLVVVFMGKTESFGQLRQFVAIG